MTKKNQPFNIVISGVGGQGLITLGRIICQAAFLEGKDIKMSELHGLSQRGGSVSVQVIIGKNLNSPLVPRAQADLVLALEASEALKNCHLAAKNRTTFLINNFFIYSPSFGDKKQVSLKDILKTIRSCSRRTYVIEASKIVEEKLGSSIVAGIYMVSGAVFGGLIPLKPVDVLKAIKMLVPKNPEINIAAFRLAQKSPFQ